MATAATRLSPADTKTRILDAAESCFASSGFHSTTMQDICKAAGISAGALYVYFASKEALIAGLTARDRAQILGNVAYGEATTPRSATVGTPDHIASQVVAVPL